MTIGNLSSFIMYTISFSIGIMAAGGTLNSIVSAAGIAEKLFEIMDIP